MWPTSWHLNYKRKWPSLGLSIQCIDYWSPSVLRFFFLQIVRAEETMMWPSFKGYWNSKCNFIFVYISKRENINCLLGNSMVPSFEGVTKMNLCFWILQTLLLMLFRFSTFPLLVSIQTPISQLRPYINRYIFMTDHLYDI